MDRPPPDPTVLARSRELNNVPAGWVWSWCANPACHDFVWHPQVQLPQALPLCAAVCGPDCARAVIEQL